MSRSMPTSTARSVLSSSQSIRSSAKVLVLLQDSVKMPAVRDALELVLSGVLEDEAGADGEVLHGRGDPDLVRPRQRRHPRTDVYGDALDVPPDELDLTGVAPRPDAKADGPDRDLDCPGTADGSGRTVEGRQEPVSSRVDVASPVLGDPAPRELVVGGEPDEIQARLTFDDPPMVDRLSPIVLEDGEIDPREVRTEPRAPDDVTDVENALVLK
jgi:hypothetical protein